MAKTPRNKKKPPFRHVQFGQENSFRWALVVTELGYAPGETVELTFEGHQTVYLDRAELLALSEQLLRAVDTLAPVGKVGL